MYVYIEINRDLWSVGFYKPDGKWEEESNWDNFELAAKRVHYLNGGKND